ncbi:type II secretion system F family protein [Aeromicrobium sp. Sec7.5]|uniref:type II secretion system F family protein n=1 Tax=Aeromicrobium sp. Sec7.5 TaxID=3121276 RepID=UPI002FE4E15C
MSILGLLIGACLAGGVILAVAAWLGWSPPPLPTRSTTRLTAARDRLWKSTLAIVVVAVVTRWPVAAVAAGTVTWMWPALFGGTAEGRAHLARLESVATWTESLRDTMAAAIGLEQAIIASAEAAPPAIAPELNKLVGRLRAHVPLPQALAAFGEDLDDPSVDLVVAALIMNARLRGSGLTGTLTALAETARSELEMRTRVEESRNSLRRDARIIVGVAVGFAGGVMLLSRTYLEPYGTAMGQLMLMLILGCFIAGFAWIRSASRIELPERFLVRPQDLVLEQSVGGR